MDRNGKVSAIKNESKQLRRICINKASDFFFFWMFSKSPKWLISFSLVLFTRNAFSAWTHSWISTVPWESKRSEWASLWTNELAKQPERSAAQWSERAEWAMRVNEHSQQSITDNVFLGATKHLYNWLCLLVGQSVGRLVTHLFDDPHVAPIGLLGLAF